MNCSCSFDQDRPSAAKRPGRGDSHGRRSDRSKRTASLAACRHFLGLDARMSRSNRRRLWPLPMHASQGAREGNRVQRRAAHLEERRAFCITRLGRELSGEWAVGRTLGFADQDSGKNPARTQNFAALSRKTWVGGSDLRAARGGAGENGAELTDDGNQPHLCLQSSKGPDGNGAEADSVILRESRGSDSALERGRRARENER